MQKLVEWLTSRNGIAHRDDAVRHGFTRYAIACAVEARQVRRIRRYWIAAPGADGTLARAARLGGKVACVSAAKRAGLWVLDHAELHITVPPNAGHALRDGAIRHWGSTPLSVAKHELTEPLVNALWHIADCQPFDAALATWESAVRTRAVSIDVLTRLPLRSAIGRRVRDGCSQLSDSGIESIPVARLARIGIRVRQQVHIDGHHVDGLIGDRLVYQIDGYEFHRTREQRAADIAHDRRLRLMGYTVLRFEYDDVLFNWDLVELQIRTAMAQGLHVAA